MPESAGQIDAPVLIVGAGVSGLVCAYFLARSGIRSIVLEKGDCPGGLIRTDHVLGCDLEAGPDSFLAAKTEVRTLAASLGIEHQLISANETRRRVFIGRHGKLELLPAGMVLMAPSDLPAVLRSSFFSWSTKLRFLRELAYRKQTRNEDISIASFVSDHFGSEVLIRVAEPLLTGVYGGEAGKLSVRSVLPRFLDYERQFGSVIHGVKGERRQRKQGTSLFQSFAGGMQTLTDTLAQALPAETIVLRSTVESLAWDGAWTVLSAGRRFRAKHIVLALPSYESGRLLQKLVPEAAAELEAIPYSSAILVTLLFRTTSFEHPLDGFGFLIPAPERNAVAAATWVNSKFPERIAAGYVAVRSFVVGAQAKELAAASDATITARVQVDLQHWMGITAAPVSIKVDRWPQSMPQYSVGHSARVETISRAMASTAGLHLCGNAYSGVGIPDCVRLAQEVAERITQTN